MAADIQGPPPSGRIKIHKLTASQVRKMAKHGIFRPEDKYELLGGFLVDRVPRRIGRDHLADARRLVQRTMRSARGEPESVDEKPRLYRLTVAQVMKMLEWKIFRGDEKFELLGGLLIEKMTANPPHNFAVGRLDRLFLRLLGPAWEVREEKAVSLGRKWLPEPDIAVVRGPDTLYATRNPRAADIGFLVEVCESTYDKDRGPKWRRYAAHRIPVYWIVNLDARRVEVYRDPAGRGHLASYRTVEVFGPGDEVPVIVEGREAGRVAVDDILPQTIRP